MILLDCICEKNGQELEGCHPECQKLTVMCYSPAAAGMHESMMTQQ